MIYDIVSEYAELVLLFGLVGFLFTLASYFERCKNENKKESKDINKVSKKQGRQIASTNNKTEAS